MIIPRSYKIAAGAALLFVSAVSFAQTPALTDQPGTSGNTTDAVNDTWRPSLVKDGVYDRTEHRSVPLMWQPVREADIMWKKRVWREINTLEKQNLAFRYPGDEQTGGGYFIEILIDAIKKGKIKAYSNFDDRFTQALTKEQIIEAMTGTDDSTEVYDPTTNTVQIVVTHKDFDPDAVTKYRIKEDWMFDRNLGRMVVRIIGIAPVQDIRDPVTNEPRGQSALFWIYYPEAREVLAQYEVFNPENDVQRLTWDDFFEGRFFSSRIIKISNPFDQYIQGLPGMDANPMEALYESQRTAEMLFNKEHDMWVY
jgi:gliding motility associated protien GldN